MQEQIASASGFVSPSGRQMGCVFDIPCFHLAFLSRWTDCYALCTRQRGESLDGYLARLRSRLAGAVWSSFAFRFLYFSSTFCKYSLVCCGSVAITPHFPVLRACAGCKTMFSFLFYSCFKSGETILEKFLFPTCLRDFVLLSLFPSFIGFLHLEIRFFLFGFLSAAGRG